MMWVSHERVCYERGGVPCGPRYGSANLMVRAEILSIRWRAPVALGDT